MIYIYGLRCPIAGQIRYIGKSVNPERRAKAHLYTAVRGDYNHHTARWLRKLAKRGLVPELCILREVVAGERWQDAERAAIADALSNGAKLTNATAGGEGLDYVRPEDRAKYARKMSIIMRELWNKPERKAQASARSIKAWSDPEVNARRAASMMAANKRPEVKDRYRAASRATAARPEVKSAKSRSTKVKWTQPEYRQIIEAHRNSPEFIQAQALRLENRWQDEDHRSKMMAARWSEDQRREQAERLKSPERAAKIKATLSDPELIKRRNAAIKASWAKRRANDALRKA